MTHSTTSNHHELIHTVQHIKLYMTIIIISSSNNTSTNLTNLRAADRAQALQIALRRVNTASLCGKHACWAHERLTRELLLARLHRHVLRLDWWWGVRLLGHVERGDAAGNRS